MTQDWVAEAARLGLPLSAAQQAQFAAYEVLLLLWNERLNLTAVRTPEAIRHRHFFDSLSCGLVLGELNGRSLIDVGTGAGFPGLPLKLLYPELQLTLVESVGKKAAFLQTVVAELDLAGVTVVTERAETLGQQPAFREQFDWAVARAVAPLRVLVEYLLPLCRVGGQVLAQKGERAAEEVAEAETAVSLLGGGNLRVQPAPLDGHFVLIEKIVPTPAAYPRRPGMPSKRPL